MGYKLNRIMMRPNGVEKQVRPTGWEPGANTIAYYKFDGNLNDSSGNNRNLSMYAGSFSYSTLSSGQPYCQLNTSATTTEASIPYSFVSSTYSAWVSFDQIRGSGNQGIIIDFRYSSNYWYRVFTWVNMVLGVVSLDSTGVSGTANTRYNVLVTNDNNSVKLYINGTYIGGTTYSGGAGNGALRINGAIGNTTSSFRTGGKISELIIEDKVRTAQEISDYYNQTKSNYGL